MRQEHLYPTPLCFRTLDIPATMLNTSLGDMRQMLLHNITHQLPDDKLQSAFLVPSSIYHFRCFKRKSSGLEMVDYMRSNRVISGSTLPNALSTIHAVGIEKDTPLVPPTSPSAPRLAYFFPNRIEIADGVDRSYCIVWSTNADGIIRTRSYRDRVIGILEVRWELSAS